MGNSVKKTAKKPMKRTDVRPGAEADTTMKRTDVQPSYNGVGSWLHHRREAERRANGPED
jgi:hypothetical protein